MHKLQSTSIQVFICIISVAAMARWAFVCNLPRRTPVSIRREEMRLLPESDQ